MAMQMVLCVFKRHPTEKHKFLWVSIFYTDDIDLHPDESFTVKPGHDANFNPIMGYLELAAYLKSSGRTNLLDAIDQAFDSEETYRRAAGKKPWVKKLSKRELAEKLARWSGEY